MSRFNTRSTTATTNLAGGKAYTMTPEMELLHGVLSTFLDDKYYESGEDRMARLKTLIAKVDPEFTARLAVIARKEFHLRSVTTLLLGELARVHRGNDLVKRAIVASVVRVDDTTELISYLGKPLPKQVKRGIRNSLYKFTGHQLAKYKGEGKKVSLVDVFNLVHPKVEFASEEQKDAWAKLLKGELKSKDTWESELSNKETDEERAKALVYLIVEDKMGYMALLRNLNNIIKYKLPDEVKEHVAKRIADHEQVKRSKQLPFRFLTAYDNVKGERIFTDAISQAMDYALDNVPKLSGKTLIAIDSSGSMMGGWGSDGGDGAISNTSH